MSELQPVTAGFLPLLDSVILIAAREKGFAAAEGIDLVLVRETSWANVRDRVAVGHFDVAHMLAPMPIAANLGLTPIPVPVVAPMALGLGGNAVTISDRLWRAIGTPRGIDASDVGKVLAGYVAADHQKLRFAVVHPFSGHNYELRYWLAGCGIHPGRDVEIVVLPPALLPDALANGDIDGYCVGEPWNSVGVGTADGQIATVKAAIWRSSPEKVLGVTERWADSNPGLLAALLRALYRSAQWCGAPENAVEISQILARPGYIERPAELLERGLTGNLHLGAGRTHHVSDFFVPHARAANFPWTSHALWFYSQMVRWGDIEHSADNARRAAASFRPDLYRAAVAPLGAPVPAANSKVEGAIAQPTPVGVARGTLLLGPDGFFDGRVFDPEALDHYILDQRTL